MGMSNNQINIVEPLHKAIQIFFFKRHWGHISFLLSTKIIELSGSFYFVLMPDIKSFS